MGIWKSLRLESWSVVRLGTVRPLASLDGTNGVLEVHAELEWAATPDQSSASIAVKVAGIEGSAEIQPGETSAVVPLVVPDVAGVVAKGLRRATAI